MREKILLIDGHSILHRAFYGIPDLTSAEGLHTNAVYGFLNIMFKILDEEKPQYLAVAFDLHAPTFRHKMYDAYKGTRKPMPEELRQQVPLMKEMLSDMGIPLMMLEGYEADDLIGTVSKQSEEKGLAVTILSGDRDLLQLASDATCVRIPKTKRTGTEVEDYFAKDVLEKYLVTPAQIIELKALMGDASDNIPGLPGVGEKTATKIITAYGNIENAHAHMDEITPAKARKAFEEHFDLAQLSKELATINREAPFDLDFDAAKLGDLYTQEALELCRRLGFRNMLSRFEGKTKQEQPRSMKVLESEEEIQSFFEQAKKAETIGLSFLLIPGQAFPRAAAVSFDGMTACMPLYDGMSAQLMEMRISELCAGAGRVCLIGLKRQLGCLGDAAREKLFDAAIGAYLLDPLQGAYTYDGIARRYAGLSYPAYEELAGKVKPEKILEEKPDAAYEAVMYEASAAVSGCDAILEELGKTGMRKLFDEIEMPLVFTLYDMEKAGILVKGEELHAYGERLSVRIQELEQQIYEQAGETFNIQSPKQLGVILFEKLQMQGGKKTKTGYSTAADVLEKLAPEHQIVADILEYRQLTKLKSTYADGLAAFIGEDGRIHGRFHQTVTATGRISSTDPNLQNIPVRTKLGRELRRVFVPADGCIFVDADYSQIELRVLAHVSGDEKLIGAYRDAQDIHAITASQVFHIPLEKITPQERRNAKAVNFGIVYGISSFGLSQDLSITRAEAQAYIEKYFETYPGIKKFLDGSVALAKEKGYVQTLYGRRRPVPELKSANFMTRSFGERVAMNSPVQGTAADIIKIAMVRVHDRLQREGLKARLLLQVHDELLVEAPLEEQQQVEAILREEMTGAADLSVVLEIDMHAGYSWYEAH